VVTWRVDTLSDVLGHGWDSLVHPDDLFHSPAWLSLENDRSDIPPRYYLAGDADGRPQAAMSCYPLAASSEPWPFMRVDRTLWHLAGRYSVDMSERTAAAIGALLPSYLCGSRRSPDTRVLTSPACAEDQRPRFVAEVVGAAERDALEHGAASVSFLFVHEVDTVLRGVLAQRGYVEFPTARYATLPLPKPGFAAYLDMLPNSRRRDVRRERRRMAEAGVRFGVEPLSPDLVGEIVPLQLGHGRKYGHAYTVEALTRSLTLHIRHCGAAARVVTARSPDGVLRGFSLLIERGDRLFVNQTGCDYQWQGKLPIYFALCYYEPVEHASSIGVTTLDYAIEAEQTKVSRGCVLEQRYGYLKLLGGNGHSEVTGLLGRLRQAAGSRGG
jgi:uncharacterized protein